MELNAAIELLRNAVKESHLPGQKHVDLSLVQADERAQYETALMFCRQAVIKGDLTDDELKTRLGIL